MLAGIKGGNADYPCFLCPFYANKKGKADHYVIRNWGTKSEEVAKKAKKGKQLVSADKLLFPPLHIQLGLVNVFMQTLDQDSEAFGHIISRFPKMQPQALFRGSLNGKDIQALFKDEEFEQKLAPKHKAAWESFRDVSWNFLGTSKIKKCKACSGQHLLSFLSSKKSPDFRDKVERLVQTYEVRDGKMTVKLHFLAYHLDHFPENVGLMGDQQGECGHQVLRPFEQRYKNNVSGMLADYVWVFSDVRYVLLGCSFQIGCCSWMLFLVEKIKHNVFAILVCI